MKYIFMLLLSFTLQAQSLLLLFDDEADSTTTLPPAVWSQDPTLQMFTNAVPTLGNELVTNGDFSSATGWTAQTGWAIGSGVATATGVTSGNISQNNVLEQNSYYLISQDVVISAGTARLVLVNPNVNTVITFPTTGNYKYAFNSAATNSQIYYFGQTTPFSGSIDNISCKKLTNFTPPVTATDYAGSANGVFSGGMETADLGTNASGIEKGFVFDGVNDFVAVACTTSTTNSTLTAWVKFTTTGAERYIFGTTTGYVRKSSSEIIQASSGTIYVDGQPYSGSAITAGWHQITVTGIALSGTVLNIGASITPGSYLAGFIDRAGRFNGTLSANQVLKLYNDQKSRYGL